MIERLRNLSNSRAHLWAWEVLDGRFFLRLLELAANSFLNVAFMNSLSFTGVGTVCGKNE